MGPTVLFDKSFLQSLSVDESVMFDRFFIAVICPVFYVETLADLEKAVRQARTPEQEVGIIAQKFPEMSGTPCAPHIELCIGNLMGHKIPMEGRIPMIGGRPVKVDDRRGVVYEERPEAEAFRRWQVGEFLEVERRFAKGWRSALNSVDLMAVASGIRAMGISPETCKSLEQARQMADRFVRSNNRPLDILKFAILALGLPLASEPYIAERWKNSGFIPLVEYAPFAAHVLSVEVFFQIALGANLISAGRASNREDVAYLSYLPFCMIFVSSDKLHSRIAPHFLRPDQSFVWGPDLKADLQRLVARYRTLPQDEQEKGLMTFASTPPEGGDHLVTQLWKHHFGLLRQREREGFPTGQAQDEEVERAKRFKPLPSDEQDLVKHLNRFADAPEIPNDEIDFDTSNPDVLSIGRQVHKKKGSFWQLPKDLTEKPS